MEMYTGGGRRYGEAWNRKQLITIRKPSRMGTEHTLCTWAKKHFHSDPLLALMQSWLTPPLQFCILNTAGGRRHKTSKTKGEYIVHNAWWRRSRSTQWTLCDRNRHSHFIHNIYSCAQSTALYLHAPTILVQGPDVLLSCPVLGIQEVAGRWQEYWSTAHKERSIRISCAGRQ